MQEATSPYSKILENEVCTSFEFLFRCGTVLHPVERWKASHWMFFHLFKCWNQSIINVEVCVDLNFLFHKNHRWLPRFGDCSPHHEWKRLLSAVDCSYRIINDCWRFCVYSVILVVNRSFNCEEFFIIKNYFLLCHPAFKSLRIMFALSRFFLLLDMYEVLSLYHFVWKHLEIILLNCMSTRIHVVSHLSCRSLQIPLYPFVDSFNHQIVTLNATLIWKRKCDFNDI